MYFRVFAAFVFGLLPSIAVSQTMVDSFDKKPLELNNWSTKQIREDQLDYVTDSRCGAGSVIVTVREGDGGKSCDDDCRRAEVRTSTKLWPRFGDEVWFAYSFRVAGDVPSTGSARSVIGQWKGPGDFSPMVAQRFDNGVFHITVQDNEVRRVVASAAGDPERMLQAQEHLGKLDRNDPDIANAVRSLQSIELLLKTEPNLSREIFSDRLQDLLGDQKDPKGQQLLSQSLGLGDSGLVSDFQAMSFVAEPELYLGPADIQIIAEKGAELPDPRKGWVDMLYRMKPGRTDNEVGPRAKGELEIWANGNKIALVRGNIGATLKTKDNHELLGPYFKFGTYRLRVPGAFRFQFDEFSQASKREDIAALCKLK